jgi:hypothetical protein
VITELVGIARRKTFGVDLGGFAEILEYIGHKEEKNICRIVLMQLDDCYVFFLC